MVNLLKCRDCGGVVLSTSPLRCKCNKCNREYEIAYMKNYEEKTDFFNEYYNAIKAFVNSMDVNKLDALITAALLSKTLLADEDTVFYAQYEIEYCLICAITEASQEVLKDFVDYPTDTNCVNAAYNVLSNIRDVIYGVSKDNGGKIDFKFVMSWFSNYVLGYINKAWNYGSDRWNRYSHEEDDDGWREYITIIDNCITVLDTFDKYGPTHLELSYNSLIKLEEIAINLTYVHHYWIGDYRATQNVGLTEEAKSIRRKSISEYERRKAVILNETKRLEEERRRKEQERLEAERQERIKKFWEENQEYKEQLLKEKEDLTKEIEELKAKRDAINADKEIQDLKEEIQLANSTLAALGFFAMKEKKAKRAQIEQLNKDITGLRTKIRLEKEEVQKVIDAKNNRLAVIEEEFVRDR